ncbi:MAG: type III pantothenate kinase [Verrucomicrobiota bacterium]
MDLCIDIGNSNTVIGLFNGEHLGESFRVSTQTKSTSDEMGLLIYNLIRSRSLEPREVKRIAISSVVPGALQSLQQGCRQFFDLEPFVLKAGVKTGLSIKTRVPEEVGADRIANAIGGISAFPGSPLIIVDFGTATTFCAITQGREYLGGLIAAGMRLSMEALYTKTAKLNPVPIEAPEFALGKDTTQNIQSGLFLGQVGLAKEAICRLTAEVFPDQKPLVIGTGGFAPMLNNEIGFDHVRPNLTLEGLRVALERNL